MKLADDDLSHAVADNVLYEELIYADWLDEAKSIVRRAGRSSHMRKKKACAVLVQVAIAQHSWIDFFKRRGNAVVALLCGKDVSDQFGNITKAEEDEEDSSEVWLALGRRAGGQSVARAHAVSLAARSGDVERAVEPRQSDH